MNTFYFSNESLSLIVIILITKTLISPTEKFLALFVCLFVCLEVMSKVLGVGEQPWTAKGLLIDAFGNSC